ncbi:methyltransferase domain-containing protein, partial [Streptococcus pneumoniae]|uniref:methyltransferase domain-containing protein n=1 Tax=Streptococcus pneumoniae TaxID=1313 RepID=UPI0013D91E8E
AQEALDQAFMPFEEMLVEPLAAGAASRVMDVGCGTGGTTLAARRLGAQGRCVGIDISDVMIAAARARAEREHIQA